MGLLNSLQENIDRTIEAMDHVIAFYNVSKEVEPTVAQVRARIELIGASMRCCDLIGLPLYCLSGNT